MKIRTEKTGGIWHGYLEGHPEIDERGLTEEMARRKVERIMEKLDGTLQPEDAPIRRPDLHPRKKPRRR